jgi:hypothetical protein
MIRVKRTFQDRSFIYGVKKLKDSNESYRLFLIKPGNNCLSQEDHPPGTPSAGSIHG